MKKRPADKIKRILIMKWSALGDLMISSAVFEDICQHFPSADIDLSTGLAYQKLFAEDPRFNKVLAIDLNNVHRGFKGIWRWVQCVCNESYDLIFDLQSNDRSRLFLSIVRCLSFGRTTIVGLHKRYPYHLAPEKNAPAGFERQRCALASAGLVPVTMQPKLHVPSRNHCQALALLQQNDIADSPFYVFVPGSNPAGKLKRWGAERYAALAEALFDKGHGPAVLIGGPDDADECRAITESVKKTGSIVNLCCQTEILDIVPIANKARFIIANDTGPTHVASASRQPMLVICGPTDPARVKPAGEHVEAIQADLDCINCYRKECSHHSCMSAITTDMILARIELMLARCS